MMEKITITDILKKKDKEKIVMLTCYDHSFAKILDNSGVEIILVGDSLANVVLGLKETRRVSFLEMLNHTHAVASACKRSLVVADMPYVSLQKGIKRGLFCAEAFIRAGADAVKMEWFEQCEKFIKEVIRNKIPVMGHIGLTPQTAHLLGGFKVQGRDKQRALELFRQAKILERLGVFSLVLECIPYPVAALITKNIKIPTIGIGAGRFCDGQVLVLYDLLGLYQERRLKFVKVYQDLSLKIKEAIESFSLEVKTGRFPTLKESFSLKKKDLGEIKEKVLLKKKGGL